MAANTGCAGLHQRAADLIRVEHVRAQRQRTVARRWTCRCPDRRSALRAAPLYPFRACAATRLWPPCTVFCISIAIVSAPTPPGTGVYAPETANAAGSMSPTSVDPRSANCFARACVAGEESLPPPQRL